MRVQEHLGKISWSLADKALVLFFALVGFVLMSMSELAQWGLWALLSSMNLWIFQITTSFGLMGLIQFGTEKEDRPKVDLISFVLHSSLAIAIGLLIFAVREPLADVFKEPLLIKMAYYLIILIIATIPRYYVLTFLQRDYKYRGYFFVNLAYFGSISIFILYKKFTTNFTNFDDIAWIFIIGSAISSLIFFRV